METVILQRGEENVYGNSQDTPGWQTVQTVWLSLGRERSGVGDLAQLPQSIGFLSWLALVSFTLFCFSLAGIAFSRVRSGKVQDSGFCFGGEMIGQAFRVRWHQAIRKPSQKSKEYSTRCSHTWQNSTLMFGLKLHSFKSLPFPCFMLFLWAAFEQGRIQESLCPWHNIISISPPPTFLASICESGTDPLKGHLNIESQRLWAGRAFNATHDYGSFSSLHLFTLISLLVSHLIQLYVVYLELIKNLE